MKISSSTRHFNRASLGLCLVLAMASANLALGDTLYFDTNGATPGSGVVAAGNYATWTGSNYWSTSSAGDVATGAWISGDDAFFVAGGTLNVPYAVTLAASTTTTVGAITVTGSSATVVTFSGTTGSVFNSSGIFNINTLSASSGLTISKVLLTGTSGLVKNGAGILSISSSTGTYTGDTSINAGTLRVATNNTMPSASVVNLNGNTAVFQNFGNISNTVAGISGTFAGAVVENGFTSGVSTLTIKATSGTQSFAGTIRNTSTGAGVLNIVKDGAYVQRLSGSNAYAGATTITAGTLLINGNNSAATGAVSVASGAILGGTGTIGGTTTLAAGAFLSPGDASSSNLTFSGSLNISAVNDAGNLIFTLTTVGASDKITSGALLIGTGVIGFNDFAFTPGVGFDDGIYTLFHATGITGTLDNADLVGLIGGKTSTLSISGNDIQLTVVPEPTATSLLALSLLLLFYVFRSGASRRIKTLGLS